MIVDPWGVVLAQAPDEECFIAADLDLERAGSGPRDAPVARQPPPGAYRVARGAR